MGANSLLLLGAGASGKITTGPQIVYGSATIDNEATALANGAINIITDGNQSPRVRADMYCTTGNCLFGFDAEFNAYKTGGSIAVEGEAVEEWRPITSENASWKLVQTTSTMQPTLVTSANGRRAIQFTKVGTNDANNDRMQLNSGVDFLKNRTAVTWVIVYKCTTSASTNRLWTIYNSTSSTWHQATIHASTGAPTIGGRAVGADSAPNMTITGSFPNSNYYILVCTFDYANQAGYVWINGTLVSSAYDTSSTNATATENLNAAINMWVGGRADNQENFNGEILWFGAYKEVLSEYHRLQLTMDLAEFYGITIPITVRTATPKTRSFGTNLTTNPDFVGSTSWELVNWTYDAGTSYDGTGGSVTTSTVGATIRTNNTIAITPGEHYTIAIRAKASALPCGDLSLVIQTYNSSDVFIRNMTDQRHSFSAADTWEECAHVFVTMPGETKIKIKVEYLNTVDGLTRTFRVDSIRLMQGIGFLTGGRAKTPFNGAITRVDGLGNIEIKNDGYSNYRPFFPFAIYASTSRADWTIYSAVGFNMNMWGWDAGMVARARAAISTFNPKGMLSGIDFSGFALANSTNPGETTLMGDRIDGIINAGLSDSVVFWYVDNENAHAIWKANTAFLINQIVRVGAEPGPFRWYSVSVAGTSGSTAPTHTSGTAVNGTATFLYLGTDRRSSYTWTDWTVNTAVMSWLVTKDTISTVRQRPIYVLQGQAGLTRKWKNATYAMQEITGCYTAHDLFSPSTPYTYIYENDYKGATRIAVQDYQENNTCPPVIAQINKSVGYRYRARCWQSIGQGAKGIGTWKDKYEVVAERLENQLWYSQIPQLRREFDAAIGLIRTPHWTYWTAASSNAAVDVYTRMYNSLGHLILTNEGSTAATATITVTNLPYTASSVVDFFDQSVRATPTANAFSITIPAYEAYVVRLAR